MKETLGIGQSSQGCFSKEKMIVSLGAGVDHTERCPTESFGEGLCPRGHREGGLLETSPEREPHLHFRLLRQNST